MANTWTVVYRTGGTARCAWHRVLDSYPNETSARSKASEIERMGYRALVFITRQLDAIGMPEGWDSDSPLRGEMAAYLD